VRQIVLATHGRGCAPPIPEDVARGHSL
jgi:hypothetical protein